MITNLILIFGIILVFFILYTSIVPCKINENNDVETFELPFKIESAIDKRTDFLKSETVIKNIVNRTIKNTSDEIQKIKDKLNMMIQEAENNNNTEQVLMFNTNGELSVQH